VDQGGGGKKKRPGWNKEDQLLFASTNMHSGDNKIIISPKSFVDEKVSANTCGHISSLSLPLTPTQAAALVLNKHRLCNWNIREYQ
jgi:hypothetical protein